MRRLEGAARWRRIDRGHARHRRAEVRAAHSLRQSYKYAAACPAPAGVGLPRIRRHQAAGKCNGGWRLRLALLAPWEGFGSGAVSV